MRGTGPTPSFAVSGVVVVKASTLRLSDARVTLIRPEDLDCPVVFRSSGVVIASDGVRPDRLLRPLMRQFSRPIPPSTSVPRQGQVAARA
jgi:hypothetical protein